MATKTSDRLVKQIKPVFGQTYDIGYLGFTRCFGFVSDAIAYGERWEREQAYPQVTHAFVVTGPGECIEAHEGTGVAKAQLAKYLTDPRTKVYFRQPRPWTPVIGHSIAALAYSKQGCSYDDLLILEDALADSLVGHWLNKLLHNWPHRLMSWLLMRPDRFICSYLAAFCLAGQPQFAGRLASPLAGIDPQMLFETEELCEPFINDCSIILP